MLFFVCCCWPSLPVEQIFPLQDAAGQTRPVLADSSSSQRPVPVAETKIPEPLPEFDPDNPLAIGIILAFHRWPDEDEQRIILEKTREAGLTKTKEIPRFKIWLFEWDEWRKAATAEKVCRSLPDLSFVEYCEPDSLLGPAAGSVNKCRLRAEIPLISRVQISQATSMTAWLEELFTLAHDLCPTLPLSVKRSR